MRPIPKSLLVHSATAVTKSEPDMWGNATDDTRTELTSVRIEPSAALTLGKDNQQIKLSAVLIFDCHNSRPKGFDFPHAQKIEYNGEQYNIVSVDKMTAENRLHHFEVELCL